MSTINVNVPDAVMLTIVERAKNSGFADVNEFVSHLVLRLADRQAEVEGLAIEGIESGSSEPWVKGDIDSIRADLRTKYGE